MTEAVSLRAVSLGSFRFSGTEGYRSGPLEGIPCAVGAAEPFDKV
jgi:hypothetical protein